MIPINVSQQIKEPVGSMRSYDIDEEIDIESTANRIQGQVTLIRTNRSILVKGRLQADAEISCSRCLNMFHHPLEFYIEEEYFPITDDASLPKPDEPSCFIINERHLLDLTEAVQQYALLAIPMKPLCRRDCAGLCPHCGCNRNEGLCYCIPQQAYNSPSDL